MSVQQRSATQEPSRRPISNAPADLETTAELPALEVEAHEARSHEDHLSNTDTWSAPHAHGATPPAIDESAAQQLRVRVEDDLKSLSANLRDVEERLASKGQRLIALENELASAREAHGQTERRVQAVTRELSGAHEALAAARAENVELSARITAQDSAALAAQSRDTDHLSALAANERTLGQAQQRIHELESTLAAHHEALQSHEGRRSVFEGQLRGFEGEIRAGEMRCRTLENQLQARAQEARELGSELNERGERLRALEDQVSSLAGALAKRNAELAAASQASAELKSSVRVLTELSAVQAERLKSTEADLTSRTHAHGETLRVTGDLRRELEAGAASLAQRVAALEVQLATAHGLADEQARALTEARATQAQHSELTAAAQARASQLEAQLAEQGLAVRTLHEELRERAGRGEARETELHAAAQTIQRLEGELRAKAAKIEELVRLGEERRATVEAACQELAERDALIRRLESEASNSAALLDNIQHRIGFLEPPALGAEPAPEGATRLLIREEGDVVHVLGRKTSLGRTPDNDVQIETKYISRHHAVILAGPVHTIIEDLNSTNGVAVNGRKITRQTLKDGDAVTIGKTQFRFATRPAPERR